MHGLIWMLVPADLRSTYLPNIWKPALNGKSFGIPWYHHAGDDLTQIY